MTRKIATGMMTPAMACLFSFLAGAQEFPRYLKDEKLEGKVKTMTVITNDETREMYTYDERGNQTGFWFFKPVELLLYRFNAVYNEQGQLTEESKFDKGYAPATKFVYAYSKEGLPIGRSLYAHDNKLNEKYIYSYDGLKRMTDSIRLDQYGNVLEKYTREFNEKGQKVKEIYRLKTDSIISVTDFEYNKTGRLEKEKKYIPGQQVPLYTSAYGYDEKGNKIMEEKHFPDPGEDYKELYGYDENNNRVSLISFAGNEKLTGKIIRSFDKNNNLIEETRYDAAGQPVTRFTYNYDEKNNETERKRYLANDNPDITITWQYEYDEKANWTKKSQFINEVRGEVVKREIGYY